MAGVALIAGIIAVVVLGSGGSDDSDKKKPFGRLTSGRLAPVPTNKVNASGQVSLRVKGNVAIATVRTNGLLNGAPHAMHIHAGAAGQCPPASAAKLHNGRLAIFAHDGSEYYGKPRTSLTTRGPTGPASIVAFDRYPTTGNIKYQRRIELIDSARKFIGRDNGVVVIHGIDYNKNSVYDGVLDRSDLDPALTGESTAAALCGPIRFAKSTSAGEPVYTASLTAQVAAPAVSGRLCHLPGTS
jgi:hypothetical protein